jgi:hypothetical protein
MKHYMKNAIYTVAFFPFEINNSFQSFVIKLLANVESAS